MGISPGTILYDATGNPVALAQGATIASTQPASMLVGSDYATTPLARTPHVDASGNLYVVTNTPSTQNANGANQLRSAITTGSGTSASASLVVNGSSTNVVFTWVPSTTTASYTLTGINFVMSAPSFLFKGSCFGQVTSTSYNGMLVQVSSGGVFSTIATIRYNEDFLAFNGTVECNQQGSTDYLHARLNFTQPIAANSGDGVKITVRDNFAAATSGGLLGLTSTANISYFEAFVEGVRLTA